MGEKNIVRNTSVIGLQVVEEEVLAFLFLLVNFAARSESTRIITEVRIDL
jgi:hypothetical protein